MCGIAGFIHSGGGLDRQRAESLGRAMGDTLAHRGPDAAGLWQDPEGGVVLAHRRLAIIDLSPAGAQPMISHDGDLVIVFNGEIYNYPELRDRLEREEPTLAGAWRGHSDTEVLLEAAARWGLAEALQAANGMFALALWDRRRGRLSLARDRFGKKPLYYGWCGDDFLFSSELKAMRRHPAFRGRVDREALAAFLRLGHVPGPLSIYRGISKLTPGTVLDVDPARPGRLPDPSPYWSLRDAALAALADPWPGSPEEAVDRLEELLGDAVGLRLISDVPLGALLSGGIDSSLITALMARRAGRAVKTFSIGFREAAHDEAPYAREVARHLGAEHTELYADGLETLAVVPQLPTLYDEPFADSSQIPTHLVSLLARRHVTVALSGDGGDEGFCGYDRYQWTPRLWRLSRALPPALRRATAWGLDALPVAVWDRLLSGGMALLPARWQKARPADNLERLKDALFSQSRAELYARLLTLWPDPGAILAGLPPPAPPLPDDLPGAPLYLRMMYWDARDYLVDDILTKVDRASMGCSLEMRAPLLDYRVVEFAWRLGPEALFPDGRGKWPLRRLAARHIPARLLDRPKMGFGVPIAAWLRGPLRPWAESLLAPGRLAEEGFLRPEPVARVWREHLSGRRDWHHHLWALLMFQAWLEHSGASA